MLDFCARSFDKKIGGAWRKYGVVVLANHIPANQINAKETARFCAIQKRAVLLLGGRCAALVHPCACSQAM